MAYGGTSSVGRREVVSKGLLQQSVVRPLARRAPAAGRGGRRMVTGDAQNVRAVIGKADVEKGILDTFRGGYAAFKTGATQGYGGAAKPKLSGGFTTGQARSATAGLKVGQFGQYANQNRRAMGIGAGLGGGAVGTGALLNKRAEMSDRRRMVQGTAVGGTVGALGGMVLGGRKVGALGALGGAGGTAALVHAGNKQRQRARTDRDLAELLRHERKSPAAQRRALAQAERAGVVDKGLKEMIAGSRMRLNSLSLPNFKMANVPQGKSASELIEESKRLKDVRNREVWSARAKEAIPNRERKGAAQLAKAPADRGGAVVSRYGSPEAARSRLTELRAARNARLNPKAPEPVPFREQARSFAGTTAGKATIGGTGLAGVAALASRRKPRDSGAYDATPYDFPIAKRRYDPEDERRHRRGLQSGVLASAGAGSTIWGGTRVFRDTQAGRRPYADIPDFEVGREPRPQSAYDFKNKAGNNRRANAQESKGLEMDYDRRLQQWQAQNRAKAKLDALRSTKRRGAIVRGRPALAIGGGLAALATAAHHHSQRNESRYD